MFGLFKLASAMNATTRNKDLESLLSAWVVRDTEAFLSRTQELLALPEKGESHWEALAFAAYFLSLPTSSEKEFGFEIAQKILTEAPENPRRMARAANIILKLAPELAKENLVLVLDGLRQTVNSVPPRSKLEKRGLKILEGLKEPVFDVFGGNAAWEIGRFIQLRRGKLHPRELFPDMCKGERFMFLSIPDLTARLRRQDLVRRIAERTVTGITNGGPS